MAPREVDPRCQVLLRPSGQQQNEMNQMPTSAPWEDSEADQTPNRATVKLYLEMNEDKDGARA